jgi:3-oxosteroid 1-dehydrogenase
MGVVLCAGGFEWNQELRDRFFPVPGLTRHSSSPEDANRGEALLAGMRIGAATEHTEAGWWIPTMHMPMPTTSNFEEIHQAAFDVGRPHSVCVNRKGVRFVDEACGYDDFGKGMVADELQTGSNCPCWLVFDAKLSRQVFGRRFHANSRHAGSQNSRRLVGSLHLQRRHPGRSLRRRSRCLSPRFREDVADMNDYARAGQDPEFGRGGNEYDRFFGDPTSKPNPSLGTDRRPHRSMRCRSTWETSGPREVSRPTLKPGFWTRPGGRFPTSMPQAMHQAARSATAIRGQAALLVRL